MVEPQVTKSRNALNEPIIRLHKGLAIYKLNSSPFWYARIRDPRSKRHVVRSTKETSRIDARKAAEELYLKLAGSNAPLKVPQNLTFGYYADELVKEEKQKGLRGEIHKRLWANTEFYLQHKRWGICQQFDKVGVRTITTVDYNSYLNWVRSKDNTLKPATMNHITSAFSKVLKMARNKGAIVTVPDLPRTSRKDNPRPFFRFFPLVSRKDDEYKKLILTSNKMANEKVRVRETVIDSELHDLVMFLLNTFLRPIETELYNLKHKHVAVVSDPRSLSLTISDGKTGFRICNTMSSAVTVYDRIKKRYPDLSGPEDYLFFPKYQNRASAKRVAQRQFNALLERCALKENNVFGYKHSLYSLRHTAICMRLTLSKGKVNIYSLAKNAGTSVDQIERFYARNLPLSAELVRNLQSFGK